MSLRGLVVGLLLVAVVAGCAGRERSGEMRHYACEDGTSFSLEVAEGWVRLHTVTGTIELPRDRSDMALFTNGLRSIIVLPDSGTRHAVGRRAWTDCSVL